MRRRRAPRCPRYDRRYTPPDDPQEREKMTDIPDFKPGTLALHGGQRAEPVTGAVMPPIFTSSTYAQSSPGHHKGFEYTRSHNPTRYALERMLAALEGSRIDEATDPSQGGFAFASGMAAMTVALDLIDHGSRIVVMDDLYGGSRRLLSKVRQRSQGLEPIYTDLTDLDAFSAAMTADTRMVWVETPTNPMMKIADLGAIAKRARQINPDVLLVCDNTFCSPILQRPLDYGFDLSMHSTTKYLNGHSDSIGGALVTGDAALAERLRFLQNSSGPIMSPFDAYLTLRGVKTLAIRMERHCASATRIAQWLEGDPRAGKVVYPGLPSHPQFGLFQQQMSGGGGMISFYALGGFDGARRFMERLRVFQIAESLGGIESLVNHPVTMTHASVPEETRAALGISDDLIRVSVGIEDIDDLLADLDHALSDPALSD
nr:LOW QUALITY PROTEIN: cystathionine beta-lyase-like [Nerophis lumbriciformis]